MEKEFIYIYIYKKINKNTCEPRLKAFTLNADFLGHLQEGPKACNA